MESKISERHSLVVVNWSQIFFSDLRSQISDLRSPSHRCYSASLSPFFYSTHFSRIFAAQVALVLLLELSNEVRVNGYGGSEQCVKVRKQIVLDGLVSYGKSIALAIHYAKSKDPVKS
ncbi:uncharacterized protein DS421_3g84270 [Arachis hypogaea]|nr:uncharacterized protein DS421_3g84270 [Arachis hypogaea]